MTKEQKYKLAQEGNAPNTGRMLTDYFKEKRIHKSALARLLGRTPATLASFEKKQSIQTTILWEICRELEHNFFADIASLLPDTFSKSTPPDTTDKERIAQLEQEVLILKAEKEVLIKVMNGNLKE